MVTDYKGQLDSLRHSTEIPSLSTVNKFKWLIFCLLMGAMVAFILPRSAVQNPSRRADILEYLGKPPPSQDDESIFGEVDWFEAKNIRSIEREMWLHQYVLGIFFARAYQSLDSLIASSMLSEENISTPDQTISLIPPSKVGLYFIRKLYDILTFALFLIIASPPIWIIGFTVCLTKIYAGKFNNLERDKAILLSLLVGILCGIFFSWIFGAIMLIAGILINIRENTKSHFNILAIASRNQGPFYSGIYGPYLSNSDDSHERYLSVPSLMVPKSMPQSEFETSILNEVSTDFGLTSPTIMELLRIIAAHGHYPPGVPEEFNIFDEINKKEKISEETQTPKNLIKLCAIGLQSLVNVHLITQEISQQIEKSPPDKESNIYVLWKKACEEHFAKTPKEVRVLLSCLTPERGMALATLNRDIVVTAWLAVISGVALCYTEKDGHIQQCSVHPDIQARAVLQSLESFFSDFNGHTRVNIRRTVMAARRHRFYGKALLPQSIGEPYKALRDCLEVLLTESDKTNVIARLVEIDALLSGIADNWNAKIKQCFQKLQETLSLTMGKRTQPALEGAVPYRNSLLLPLETVLNLALFNTPPSKIDRCFFLLQFLHDTGVRVDQGPLLPGVFSEFSYLNFDKIPQSSLIYTILKQKGGKEAIKRWTIVQRALSRANWTTRQLGDMSLQREGLCTYKVSDKVKIPLAVALRGSRVEELLGNSWMSIVADPNFPAASIAVKTSSELSMEKSIG